jgi:small membrane protein
MWIRVILLACVVATLVLFVRGQHGQRLRANKRIAFFAFLAVNAYAVLRPEDVMTLAIKLGVGRGADLVLYLLVVCFIFATLNMYLRQRQLEQRLADVTRALALREAESFNTRLSDVDMLVAEPVETQSLAAPAIREPLQDQASSIAP